MKTLRALMLVLALSVCVYAGEIPNGVTGEIPNGVAGNVSTTGNMPTDATDPITEVAITLLQSLLSLV